LPETRFQIIDESNRQDHVFLRSEDECYFLREYTSGKTYAFSETNNLISNLKKKRGTGGYQYKALAIRSVANIFKQTLNPEWLKIGTLVPVPPSRAKDDPAYDDRMLQVCTLLKALCANEVNIDVRELVLQRNSIRAAHESEGNRPSIQELVDNYVIDDSQAEPAPTTIGVVDDVLTVGTHYRAMSQLLATRFPQAKIVGLFVARRVFPNDKTQDAFADFGV
jgi:predicted amidophosphoribosyltransferase